MNECTRCHEDKPIYLDGLCVDCAHETPIGKAHPQEDDITPDEQLVEKGFDLMPGQIKRIWQQMRHIADQLDEADRGDKDKVRHAIESLKVLSFLLPGGAK